MTKQYQRDNTSAHTKQKAGYMSQLDEWTNETIVFPLTQAMEEYCVSAESDITQDEAVAKVDEVVAIIKKAIREKMLESYRNGQAARPRREGRRYVGKK